MSWFEFLNSSGIVNPVTKWLNRSQCLCLSLRGQAMCPHASDQLSERSHVSSTALHCSESEHSLNDWLCYLLSAPGHLERAAPVSRKFSYISSTHGDMISLWIFLNVTTSGIRLEAVGGEVVDFCSVIVIFFNIYGFHSIINCLQEYI